MSAIQHSRSSSRLLIANAHFMSSQIWHPVSGRDMSLVHFVASNFCNKLTWQIGPSFLSCFQSRPGCFGQCCATAFKFDIGLFTGIDTAGDEGPSLAIICKPVLVCMWGGGYCWRGWWWEEKKLVKGFQHVCWVVDC